MSFRELRATLIRGRDYFNSVSLQSLQNQHSRSEGFKGSRTTPLAVSISLFILMAGSALGQITTTNFGFQCGLAKADCPNAVLPSTQAQPGMLRIWDMNVSWGELMTSYSGGVGIYNWTTLDAWLDAIAANQPKTVWYTFGWVPCFASTGTCGSRGTATPPSDLTSSGSPMFTQFVTDFVNHCSPKGNCVKTLIKYYGTWNEANSSQYWTGTQLQLYQMIAPAWTVIQSVVSGAHLATPEISVASGFQSWMQTWQSTEVSNGLISTDYAFHRYWVDNIPENLMAGLNSQLCPNTGSGCSKPSGWVQLDWWVSETNYNTTSYVCNTSTYSSADCAGQITRWQLLLASKGASGTAWYKWMTAIGDISQSENAYYYTMQYMVGGSFSAPCSSATASGIQTWTCPFSEQNGTAALWVWTPSEAGTSYVVPAAYSDYRDLNGNTTPISTGQTVTLGVQPLLFEGTTAPTHLTASVM